MPRDDDFIDGLPPHHPIEEILVVVVVAVIMELEMGTMDLEPWWLRHLYL
jgi:hypothetical protein